MGGETSGRWCRVAAVVAGLWAGPAAAGPPAASDWQLVFQARQALWDDSTFERLNLGVRVENGVAILSGAVPSTAVADQAVVRLRKVPGIRDVVNETIVPPADDPITRSMPHPVTTQRPTVSVAPAVPAPEPAPPPPVVIPAPAKQPAATLGPPVAVRTMSLADQVEALRLADPRFRAVRVEVRGDQIVLRGSVARSADAWEFAAAVHQLPGVAGVMQSIGTR